MTSPVQAYLGLGSNQNNPAMQLRSAIKSLQSLPGCRLIAVSSIYSSSPVGPRDQPDYLNAAAQLETSIDAHELLAAVQQIEKKQGRKRTRHWGPRTLDIDILLYGDAVIDTPTLTVPHPEMHKRAFVLVPLSELSPRLQIPGGKRLDRLLMKTGSDDIKLYMKQ